FPLLSFLRLGPLQQLGEIGEAVIVQYREHDAASEDDFDGLDGHSTLGRLPSTCRDSRRIRVPHQIRQVVALPLHDVVTLHQLASRRLKSAAIMAILLTKPRSF